VGDDALVRHALERGVIGPRGTVAGLRQTADTGDAAAKEIYREAGTRLGRALAGVVHTLDPDILILLGEGIDAWQHWEPGFDASFRGNLVPSRRGPPIVVEPWDESKRAAGAAALVLASPFDSTGATGEQGKLTRTRLHGSSPAEAASSELDNGGAAITERPGLHPTPPPEH